MKHPHLIYVGVRNFPVTPTEFRSANEFKIAVKNVGPGVARKIEFEMDGSFRPYKEDAVLNDIYFLVHGVDRLVPAEKIIADDLFLVVKFDDLNQVQTTIRGTWEDLKGKKYYDDFPLNFADRNLPYE